MAEVKGQEAEAKSQNLRPERESNAEKRAESSQRGRSDGKRELAQGWIPLREQKRRLLRVRKRGPKRTLFRGLEQTLLWVLAREPLQKQDR
jgi:hypothetical protein